MPCAVSEEQLWSWVDRDAPELQPHLEDCAFCRARAAGLRAGIDKVVRAAPRPAPLPERIGPYRVLRVLGEGGQGVVYEAEQFAPARRVALKVMQERPGQGESSFRSFRREVQTLARLHHPGIASIYEAGFTDDGLAYFAMELAPGAPLNEYSRQQRLSLRERLELFCAMCEPIVFAHQRGVIHRDLKPSNILIDSAGQPRVLDFGLAHVSDADRTLTFSLACSGQIHGTLPYMSPEQARGEAADVRSDVYSLGVMLYELVTNHLPFDLRATPPHEALRALCEDEPPRPRMVNRHIPVEVEAIVLKAMAKDPAWRYASVAALAEDARRYLAGDVILARAPSALYQVRKLISRHKAPAALGVGLFVSLVALAVVASLQAARVTRERDAAQFAHRYEEIARKKAQVAAARAERETLRSQRVRDFLETLLLSADPLHARKNALSLREILDEAAERVDGEWQEDPAVEGALRAILGRTYAELMLNRAAEPQLRLALAARQAAFGSDHADLAQSLFDLGAFLLRDGRAENAMFFLDQALGMRQRLLGEDHADTLAAMQAVARALVTLGDQDGGLALARDRLTRVAGRHGQADERSLRCADDLAELLESAGDGASARVILEANLAARQARAPTDSLAVVKSLHRIGEFERRAGNRSAAERRLREAHALVMRLPAEHTPTRLLVTQHLARVLQLDGRSAEAERLLEEAAPIAEAQLPSWHYVRLCCRRQLGECLAELGRYAEAAPLLRSYYEGCCDLLRPDDPEIATARGRLVRLYEQWDAPQGAPAMTAGSPQAQAATDRE